MNKKIGVFIFMFVFSLSLVAAEYSIDISGLKQEAYSIGEEINFKVLLLENGNPISDNVNVVFSDNFGKKKIEKSVVANQESSLLIEEDFPSLKWSVKATYKDKEVERSFFVQENAEVEFSVEGDKLIIKNKGNIIYTRTIHITIGDVTKSYAQNIKIGGQKELRLLSPKGFYDIKVTDGENNFNKKNVQLYGTGNVVGAIDPNLQGTGLLGAPEDPDKIDEGIFTSDKLPIALVFIAAIFGLGILLLIEKRFRKKE